MRNSEKTKDKLLVTASTLFNTQGYNSTSISDITFASGFTKGAIYKHFRNKSELELESLRFMCQAILVDLRNRIKAEKTAVAKLKAVFQFYISHVTNPLFQGGCPVLNASVEVDDTHPDMKQLLSKVMVTFHESMSTILKNGIKFGQLRDDFDVEDLATMIISSMEGAIMMSKLADDNQYLKQVNSYLLKLVKMYEL